MKALRARRPLAATAMLCALAAADHAEHAGGQAAAKVLLGPGSPRLVMFFATWSMGTRPVPATEP